MFAQPTGLLGLVISALALNHVTTALLIRESQTNSWTRCAEEGAAIPQPGLARFGFGNSWVNLKMPAGADCSVGSFGTDPLPGVRKVCDCASDAAVSGMLEQDDLGVEWSRCADENHDCTCASGNVRFGLDTRWVVSNFTAGHPVQCSMASFNGEDPVPDSTKECWCEQPPLQQRKAAKSAIVLLTRRAPDLKLWLQYHLDYMGIDHVFMQVEDTPRFNSTWEFVPTSLQHRVSLWWAVPGDTDPNKRPSDDYQSLQDRQMAAMRHAKEQSKVMGIEWLMHIDDDELLYTPLHRPVGEVLAALPEGFDQAYIPNYEAVYPSAKVQNCFAETQEVNMNPYAFVSYANGKAAVRVSDDDAQPAGPHQWRNSLNEEVSAIHLDKEPFGAPMILIHYESCPFARWEEKYWELGNTSPEKIQKIPFPFYRDSIQRMQYCEHPQQNAKAFGADLLDTTLPECTEDALQELWASYKTKANPRIRPQDFMPLNIPWQQIESFQ